ncbi:hypothetical protein ACIBIZ_09740 [Nonomuraea spiralis]|uniref:hypothetical protein n=1 Tax=Nonomuraea spiralis TaxID=46182 RepID=UPI0037AA72AC
MTNEPPKRRFSRSLLLAATTVVVLATGAGVAYASAQSPSPSPTETPSATATSPGKGMGHGFGGPPVHGEFVVPDGKGAYVTVAAQYGEVTAVGQDSVTVKSADGYTKEYVVNADTRVGRRDQGISAIKTGQKVMLTAKVTDGTSTAMTIHDVTARHGKGRASDEEGQDEGQGRRHRDHGDRSGAPAPSPSTTTS